MAHAVAGRVNRKPLTFKEHDEIVTALRDTNATIDAIADQHTLKPDTVSRIAKSNGLRGQG